MKPSPRIGTCVPSGCGYMPPMKAFQSESRSVLPKVRNIESGSA